MIKFIVTTFLLAVAIHGQEDAVVTTQAPDPMVDEATFYIGELFHKYGVDGKLSLEGFEHLMFNLALHHKQNREMDEHEEHRHHHGHWDEHSEGHVDQPSDHEDHSNDHDHVGEPLKDHDHQDEPKNQDGHSEERPGEHINAEPLSDDCDEEPNETPDRRKRALTNSLTITHDHEHNKCLTARDLLNYYRLDPASAAIEPEYFMQMCPAIIYQLDQNFCGHQSLPQQKPHEAKAFWYISPAAWGWAFLAVTIISLVGLASVAVIPIMDKVFYNHLLQFLVALAIGTLTGDALLHLLPHAISPGGHDESEEEGHGHDLDPIWKGAVILVGIYTFFMVERIMAMITQWKRQKHGMQKQKRISGRTSNNLYDSADIGEKLCHHDDNTGHHVSTMVTTQTGNHDGAGDCQFELDSKDHEAGPMLTHERADEHRSQHGHSHEVPGNVSSVAWMVIMGDGLHNFTDGLAIGAAFADNLSVGLSTTLAVFCHELPHELGDFAVLLRAGMKVKQALVYNVVSSVLCVIGMVGGLLLGNLESAHGWIYALTAGIFIYISLVDMLPEITSTKTKKGESPCCHLLLQMLGISLGVAIMLIIAIYEDRIMISIDG